jgi:predicted esterase
VAGPVAIQVRSAWRHAHRVLFAAIIPVLAGCGGIPKPPPDVSLEQRVVEWNGRSVRMESYCSNADAPILSTVFLLHGVGGMAGDGSLMRSFAVDLARAGYEAVVVRYFDSTGDWLVTRGVALERAAEWRDMLSAVIKDHSSKFPDRAHAVLGYSLGGFLAVALAGEPTPVAAMVVLNAGVLPEHEGWDLSALPPMHILHGAKDFVVEPVRSEMLARLAGQAGVTVSRVVLDGEGHALSEKGKMRASREVIEFFSSHLQTGQSPGDALASDSAD